MATAKKPRSEVPEVYVSTDIEADGPIPGANSMLSLGSVAFNHDGKEVGALQVNLKPLPDANPDPRTMDWWKTQPKAWTAATENQRPPEQAMKSYSKWIEALPGRPVFVAYPLLFDMMFVYWYLIKFVGRSPFSHSGIDIKTLAMWAWAAALTGTRPNAICRRNGAPRADGTTMWPSTMPASRRTLLQYPEGVAGLTKPAPDQTVSHC